MSEIHKPVALDEPGAHLWGSYFAPTLQQGLEEIASTVGPYLVEGMPDGEISTPIEAEAQPSDWIEREDWVVGRLKRWRDLADQGVIRDLTLVKWGDYTGYDKMAKFKIGKDLDPHALNMGYHTAAKKSFPYIMEALESHDLTHLKIQTGIPGYHEYPTFATSKYEGLLPKNKKPFKIATDHEMIKLAGDPELEAQGQLLTTEHPVPTIATIDMWGKNKVMAKALARYMAYGMNAQVEVLPQDQSTGRHPCRGRFMGEPALPYDPEDLDAIDAMLYLADRDLAGWPKSHQKPKIYGMPLVAEGGHLPSEKTQREIAKRLADLALPKGTRLAPGIITYHTPADEVAKFQDMIDEERGDVSVTAAPCGLQSLRLHEDPQATIKVLRRHAEVVQLRRGVAA